MLLPSDIVDKRINYQEFEEREINSEYIRIPTISLTSELCNRGREFCLEEGVWIKYFDLKKRNFLLTGHNFHLYPVSAGVFYNLENVNLGDRVYIYFNSQTFIFNITNFFITDKYDIQVEDFDLEKGVLKMYTCYPNWGNRGRFVVEGEYVE